MSANSSCCARGPPGGAPGGAVRPRLLRRRARSGTEWLPFFADRGFPAFADPSSRPRRRAAGKPSWAAYRWTTSPTTHARPSRHRVGARDAGGRRALDGRPDRSASRRRAAIAAAGAHRAGAAARHQRPVAARRDQTDQIPAGRSHITPRARRPRSDLRELVLNRLAPATRTTSWRNSCPTAAARGARCRSPAFRSTRRRVRCPVLVLTGDDDRFIPRASRARRPAVSAPAQTIAGHGHMVIDRAGLARASAGSSSRAGCRRYISSWRLPTSSSRSTCASAPCSKPSRFPRRESRRSSCESTSVRRLGERRSSAQLTMHYRPEQLVGRQVVAAVNLGARRIAGFVERGARPRRDAERARSRAARGRPAGRQRHANRIATDVGDGAAMTTTRHDAGAQAPVITQTDVTWRGERLFDAGPAGRTHRIDADAKQAPGPVETLLNSLATCFGVDVVDIIAKRKTPVERMTVPVVAQRRPEYPRRVNEPSWSSASTAQGSSASRPNARFSSRSSDIARSRLRSAPTSCIEAATDLERRTFPPCARRGGRRGG